MNNTFYKYTKFLQKIPSYIEGDDEEKLAILDGFLNKNRKKYLKKNKEEWIGGNELSVHFDFEKMDWKDYFKEMMQIKN